MKNLTSSKNEIVEVLTEAGATFKGDMVYCPFHPNDNTPAGSIYEQDGHWRYKCFACGASGDATDLKAILTGGTVADVIKGNTNPRNGIDRPLKALTGKQAKPSGKPEPLEAIRARIKGVIKAQHPYYDADGELTGLIIRYQTDNGKSFLPLTAHGDLFVIGAMPKPRPLYNLPQVITAEQVVICEGEKCVDSLTAYGIISTTSSGGSNAAKQSDWKPLAGKRVIFWRDYDEAGLKYISDVKQQLAGLDCEIYEIEPSKLDLLPKEDCADYINQVEVAYENDFETVKSEIEKALDMAKPAVEIEPEPYDDIDIICCADVEPVQVQWLWYGFLAAGKITLLASDPGAGKSTVTLDIAARISRGQMWADGVSGNAPMGDTIFLSAEDDAADTIVPRLIAAGADLEKVHILKAVREIDPETGKERERCFNLERDVERISRLIKKMKSVKLLVIDPISSYLGRVDSHKNAEVRSILAPLTSMAEAHGAAVLMVSHLNKASGTKAAYRTQGSIAFSAAARISLIAAKDPDNEKRRLILPVKVNICPDNIGWAYTLEGTESGVARIAWQAGTISESADGYFERDNNSESGDAEIIDHLKELLTEAYSFSDVQKNIKDGFGGIGQNKLYDLIKRAGGEKIKCNFQGGVKWKIAT